MVGFLETRPVVSRTFGLLGMLLIMLHLNGIYAAVSNTTKKASYQLTEEIRRLFEDGNRELEKSAKYVDLTLLIGLSGAGKSTMARVISRNLSELEAYQKKGGILIKDTEAKISPGNSTYRSYTTVPEFFIDAETNSALYDFPGFSDTRGVEVEISNGHFMNEVIRHARTVRLLIVENYSSVTPGEDRDRIFKLISQTLQFVKNMAAYEGGISFLATKTRVSSDVSNTEIVEGIVESLTDAKAEIDANPSKWAGKEPHIEALFNSWLKRDDKDAYANIAFFRQPTKTGFLNTLPELPENQAWIRQMVLNNTNFAYKPCNPSHFGNPLSPSAVLKVSAIQTDLLHQTKSMIDSLRMILVENVKSVAYDTLSLSYVAKLAGPFDLFEKEGRKDFKSAVTALHGLGVVFGDDRVSVVATTLLANGLYMADLEKLPIDRSRVKTNVSTTSTSEATKEANRAVVAVQTALGLKFREKILQVLNETEQNIFLVQSQLVHLVTNLETASLRFHVRKIAYLRDHILESAHIFKSHTNNNVTVQITDFKSSFDAIRQLDLHFTNTAVQKTCRLLGFNRYYIVGIRKLPIGAAIFTGSVTSIESNVAKQANDVMAKLLTAMESRVQTSLEQILDSTKENLEFLKTAFVEKVNRLSKSELAFDLVEGIISPLENFDKGNEDLQSAVATIRKLGSVFDDDISIKIVTATLETNHVDLVDLQTTSAESGLFKIKLSLSEVTQKATAVITAFKKAMFMKLKTIAELDKPFEAAFETLRQSAQWASENVTIWSCAKSVAEASEQIGADFPQNIHVISDTMNKLNVTTEEKEKTLASLNICISVLASVQKLDPAEASEMLRGWNRIIDVEFSSLIQFSATKSKMEFEPSWETCPIKSFISSNRMPPSIGGSCQENILRQMNEVISLMETLAEYLKTLQPIKTLRSLNSSSHRLPRSTSDDVSEVYVPPCPFPKDELETLVVKLDRRLTSVNPSSATTTTCVPAGIQLNSTCESLVDVLKCSVQHIITAYQKSASTPDNLENMNTAMGIVADLSVYADQSTTSANQQLNRQWAQLSSTMRQLKVTYTCVFHEFHQLINKTISDDILLNRPQDALKWFQRLNSDPETLKWVVSKVYNDLPPQGSPDNKIANLPKLVQFFNILPQVKDNVIGFAALYDQMKSQNHLGKREIFQLYSNLYVTIGSSQTCMPFSSQLKLFAVTQLFGSALDNQWPDRIARFSRGSRASDWNEVAQYMTLRRSHFDAYRLVYRGYTGNSASVGAAIARFLYSQNQPRHTIAGLQALLKRMQKFGHVNTYDYMDVMSILRWTASQPGVSLEAAQAAKTQVPAKILNFFFPPSGGCHIVNHYQNGHCIRIYSKSWQGGFSSSYDCWLITMNVSSHSIRQTKCCEFTILEPKIHGCTWFFFESDTASLNSGGITTFRIRDGGGSLWYWTTLVGEKRLGFCTNSDDSDKECRQKFKIRPYDYGAKFTIMNACGQAGFFSAQKKDASDWWNVSHIWKNQSYSIQEPSDSADYWEMVC